MSDETTDKTTDETTSHPTDGTTSHSTRLPKDGSQVAGYKQPEDVCQVVGYSHLTNPASEKLLAGHPKDAGQVIDEATSHLTKAANCQVIGYGYSQSTDEATSQSTKSPNNGDQVAGYKRASGQVAGYNIWDERYAGEEYLFGTEPNAFLVSQRHLLKPGMSCLAVADGEGRNGVWLAEQGLQVLSVDYSELASAKAGRLAEQRGAKLEREVVDLLQWDWGSEHFDIVAAIFIQFAGPAEREILFANIKRCLKPGGLLLLQGYTPRQLEYGTGGPPLVENLYTETMLRSAFADWEILHLREHDEIINEGAGHSGMSALIDLVTRKFS